MPAGRRVHHPNRGGRGRRTAARIGKIDAEVVLSRSTGRGSHHFPDRDGLSAGHGQLCRAVRGGDRRERPIAGGAGVGQARHRTRPAQATVDIHIHVEPVGDVVDHRHIAGPRIGQSRGGKVPSGPIRSKGRVVETGLPAVRGAGLILVDRRRRRIGAGVRRCRARFVGSGKSQLVAQGR